MRKPSCFLLFFLFPLIFASECTSEEIIREDKLSADTTKPAQSEIQYVGNTYGNSGYTSIRLTKTKTTDGTVRAYVVTQTCFDGGLPRERREFIFDWGKDEVGTKERNDGLVAAITYQSSQVGNHDWLTFIYYDAFLWTGMQWEFLCGSVAADSHGYTVEEPGGC